MFNSDLRLGAMGHTSTFAEKEMDHPYPQNVRKPMSDSAFVVAIATASEYRRTPSDFDKDGPHVVTGPVFVEGAQPGDVLKIETLEATPRVPYGVVSNRHGKGALARTAGRGAPAGIGILDAVGKSRRAAQR
jgi:hypothetical protein